jgi:hypothetical protein
MSESTSEAGEACLRALEEAAAAHTATTEAAHALELLTAMRVLAAALSSVNTGQATAEMFDRMLAGNHIGWRLTKGW